MTPFALASHLILTGFGHPFIQVFLYSICKTGTVSLDLVITMFYWVPYLGWNWFASVMQISKIKMCSFGCCHFWEHKCTLSISLQSWDLAVTQDLLLQVLPLASLILEVKLHYWEWGGSNSAINRKTPEMVKFLVRILHIKANGDCAEVQFDPATLQALRK